MIEEKTTIDITLKTDGTVTIPTEITIYGLRVIRSAVNAQIALLTKPVVFSNKGIMNKIKIRFLGYPFIEKIEKVEPNK
jgi:hypothetical protein